VIYQLGAFDHTFAVFDEVKEYAKRLMRELNGCAAAGQQAALRIESKVP
jgi:hypothetical protein